MKASWVNKKWAEILIHVLAWLIVFSLPYLLRYSNDDRLRNDPLARAFLYTGLLTGIFWVVTFYLNAFILTPRLIYRRQYTLYLILVVAIFGIILLVHSWIYGALITTRPYVLANSVVFNLPTFFLTIAASIAYRVLGDKARTDKMEREKQGETLKTELSFLRSQISPHFVFNILNNITALARLKSDELEPTVMKLSSLLRYMLYETNEEKVSLQTEIEYLQSYIDLQQQRFGQKVKIDFKLENDDGSIFEIEPMLLIPFVENAFKHGIGLIPDPRIDIRLSVKNKILLFSVANRYNETKQEIKDKTSGIGLANVKRRLNLLYHKDHTLVISHADGWYHVSLQLNLH